MYTERQPTYLGDILIKNYRGIKDLELSFEMEPGVTILLGDNGVGKTSILEAIATGLSGYLEGISGSSPRNISKHDVRIHTEALGGASTAIQYVTPVEIYSRAIFNGEHFEWLRSREITEKGSSLSSSTKYSTTPYSLRGYARKLTNATHTMLPILCYLSVNRLSAPEQTTSKDVSELIEKAESKLHDRRTGYAGCLRSSIDKSMIKAWVLKMDMEQYFRESIIPEYEAFKEIVCHTMMVMSDLPHTPKLFYSRQFRDIVYQENNNQPLPISYLSAGYQSLLWIVMSIAYRIALLNPHFGIGMRETSGIVLIDELDMHLHPKWQWNVLQALQETFPNIQFIIATHSPILISSCENGHLIKIDDNHKITYVDSPYASAINNVVELVQESTSVPARVKKYKEQFDCALNDEDYDTAQQILEKMRAELGPHNREVQIATAELNMDYSVFKED